MSAGFRCLRCFREVVPRTSILAFTIAALASAAFSQSQTGTLLGLIHDEQHQAINGVEVQLSRADASQIIRHATTDTAGRFKLVGLPPGMYSLALLRTGWQSRVLPRLSINGARTLDVEVVLTPAVARDPQLRSLELFDRDLAVSKRFGQVSMHALPTTRRIWSLLENQESSTVTNRLETGGFDTGTRTLFGARGVSWTENGYSLNGFDVTDPYLPGRPLADPDYDALNDVTVTIASKPASFSGSGANLILTTPTTEAKLQGNVRAFFSGHALQSNNMDSRLVQLGFPGPERLQHLVDVSGQLSGKLPLGDSFPFFISAATQQLSKELGGFNAPIDARGYHLLTQFTPFARASKQLNVFYAGQHVSNSRAGADPRVAPSATRRTNSSFHQLQLHWSSLPRPSSTLELGFGFAQAILSAHAQQDVSTNSSINLPQLTMTGTAPFELAGRHTRYQTNAQFGLIHDGLFGSHSVFLGAAFDRSNITNRWTSRNSIEQILVEGNGAEVVRWNTPTQARQHVSHFVLFAQDSWRPTSWLSVPVGARLEHSSGQGDAGSNRISWTTVEPRLGFVMRLPFQDFILRGGFARYGHLFQGNYLDFGNAMALGGQVLQWRDTNGDHLVQPLEIGHLLRVFGGPYSAVDPSLRRPFTDEITAELSKHFGDRLVLHVRFFRRDDRHLVGVVNAGVPFSSYAPTLVIDPGTDGIAGTGDDQRLTLFNRQVVALGKDFFVLTNPSGYRGSDKGFEIEMVKPFARHWEASGSFLAFHASAPTSPGNSVLQNDSGFIFTDQSVFSELNADPNTLPFSNGRTYFDRGFTGNLIAYYEAPHAVKLGAVARYYDGLVFGRLLFVNGFEQGPFFVRATPRGDFGAFRTEFNSTLDLRVEHTSTVRHGKISLMFDVFNLLNLNKSTQQADLTSPTFSKRIPLAIQPPRTFRLGLDWHF